MGEGEGKRQRMVEEKGLRGSKKRASERRVGDRKAGGIRMGETGGEMEVERGEGNGRQVVVGRAG